MSVGLLVVRLKYGLYVGHLSKWFTFSVKLSACRLLLCRPLRLPITVRLVVVAGFETPAISAYTETSMALIYK